MSDRKFATYKCCCCSKDFQMDVTDDPDPRPSPLGDQCPTCVAAGIKRPFEASGQTLTGLMDKLKSCRFCKGDHWAMDCTGAEAEAFRANDPLYCGAWRKKKVVAAAAGGATPAAAGSTAVR